MQIKFFTRDIISGSANKVGDIFVAFFFGAHVHFKVVELTHGVIMAEYA